MKKLLAAAIVVVFMSCSGNTSSDNSVNAQADSMDSVNKNDSSAATDTVYPSTDTSSYRKDQAKPVDTAK